MKYGLPNGYMPVWIGDQVHIIVGGPYRFCPPSFKGVKMAVEIKDPCHIDIPTRDFNVPDEMMFRRGLVEGFVRMLRGQHLYVGCMGGIGRTGLYLAGIAKYTQRCGWIDQDPVEYVREHYIPHAVETDEQQQYIADLEWEAECDWLRKQA